MKGDLGKTMDENGLKVKAIKEFSDKDDLYLIVDFLNKSLKDKNLIFGLKRQGDKQVITIYET